MVRNNSERSNLFKLIQQKSSPIDMSQIFLLDVFVSHLRLYPEILKDAGRTTFIVKINFNHFPPIEVRENNGSPKILPDDSSVYLFYKGQIRYFVLKTDELVRLMKKNPLRIGVYRNGDSFPLCQVKIPLFGCACSLVSSDRGVLTIDGPFDLLDPGKNFSGQIYVNVALANYGRFVESNYSLQKETFIFKNSIKGSEFECFRVSVPKLSEDIKIDPRTSKNIPEIDWSCRFQEVIDNYIKDLIVLLPSSKYLSIQKPPIKTPHISSEETKSPKGKKEKKGKALKKGKKK